MDRTTKYERRQRRRKIRKRVLSCLGSIVVFVTTYFLILPAITMEGTYYCGLEEHTHTEACYETRLVCGLEEVVAETTGPPETVTEPEASEQTQTDASDQSVPEAEEVTTVTETEPAHTHTDSCYGQVAICGMQEHTHVLACSSDPTADVETAQDWAAKFSVVELTGQHGKDILAIAKLQLGYTESELNYGVAPDGVTKEGYTRYGAWYGKPYAQWNGLFPAFCASYAGIDSIPAYESTADLAAAMMQTKDFRDPDAYTPQSGDLCFVDTDLNGTIDRVGIVESCSTADLRVTLIEGDNNGRVDTATYDLRTGQLKGCVQLAEDPETEGTASAQSYINVAGTVMYHPAEYLEYQYSSHRVNDYMTLNYVLVPYDQYTDDWTPNTLNWSANCGANYVVAYCADRNTDVNESGESYITKDVYQSAYADHAEELAGVVEHSYPFITAAQMRAELQAAYRDGEIDVDLSCCTEAEFIAAAQWAIWDVSGLSGTQTTASGAAFPSYNADALNPLTNVGHTQAATIQSHVKAIRDWLVTKRAALKLTIADATSEVTYNGDGTYHVQAVAQLGRPLDNKETVYVTATAGDKSFTQTVWGEGVTEITIEMDGLSAQELTQAQVTFQVVLEEMQVYVYDSGAYQDMISGQWGSSSYRLSFDIEVETTSVDVTKYWSDNTPGVSYIQVQLYADGKAYGQPVKLNGDNGWKYTWSDLLKHRPDGEPVYYSIKEFLVPGYLTQILRDEGGSRTVTTLTEASGFTEGGKYVLTYDGVNALMDNGGQLDWARNQNLLDPQSVQPAAYWIASSVSTDGSAYLRNAVTGNYISYNGSQIALSAGPAGKSYFLYNRFYLLSGIYNQYLTYIDEGLGYTTESWDSALDVTLWEYSTETRQTADVSYLINNTKTTENTSLEVKKEWVGRTDDQYPESVTVQLLQNGTAYGPEVILNGENQWTYRWENLPLKLGDQGFTYTVQELELEGYTPEITEGVTEDGVTLFTIVNTWAPEYMSFRLEKVDMADNDLLLYGAEFELYRVEESEDAVPIPGQELTGILEQTLVVGDGTLLVEQLLVGGQYYLIETLAPSGYNMLTEPIVFNTYKQEDEKCVLLILSGENWIIQQEDPDGLPVIRVKNPIGYEMPKTGGIGTILYTMGGVLLMITAVTISLYNGKKRRKEDMDSS